MTDGVYSPVVCVAAAPERRNQLAAAVELIGEGIETTTVESVHECRRRLTATDEAVDCVLLGDRLTAVDSETDADSNADSDAGPDTDTGAAAIDALDSLQGDDPTVPVVLVATDRTGIAPLALDAGATDVVDDGDEAARRLAATRAVRAARRYRERTDGRMTARLRRLFENTSDGIVEAKIHGDTASIRQANRAFGDVFGVDPSSLHGRDLDEVVLPPGRQREGHEFNRRVAAGERVETEVRRHAADGVRDFLLRSVRVAEGTDRAYFVYTDITERKRREDRLHALHDATRRMMDAETASAVARVAAETCETVLGLPATTMYRTEDDHLVPSASTRDDDPKPIPLDGDVWLLGALRNSGPVLPGDLDGQVTLPSGVTDAVAIGLADHGVFAAGATDSETLDDATVQVAELLAANIEAALDRAARERLLHEREAELRNERDRFAALFENVPDPAVAYDLDDGRMRVTAVNSAFESVMGYDAETVVGADLDEFILPPDADEEATRYNERLASGESLHVEVRRQTSDGVRDFLLHGVPVTLGERSVVGFAIYTETTEQKGRERELRRQNERLEEFAGIVSHDLRNPLTVARGHRDLLAAEYDHDSLKDIGWALDRMEVLIEDVLALARKGQAVDDPEPVPFDRVAEDAWVHCETATASLDCRADGAVVADAERLTALFENLYRNSVEHGRSDATVTVERVSDGFSVADDGPGLPETDPERVFEQGFTTDRDGTGFGLAIVEDIAEAHGWSVSVDDECDYARFVFSGVEWVDEGDRSDRSA